MVGYPDLYGEAAYAVALQPDGKIVAAGAGRSLSSKLPNMLAQRFDSSGAADTSFGTGGYTLINMFGYDSQANALAIAPNGKIVLVGQLTITYDVAMGIARLNADGSIDNSFGTDGRLKINIMGDSSAAAVAISGDKIIVAGTQDDSESFSGRLSPGNFALLRLDDSGNLDPAFGDNGKARFPYPNTTGMLSSMALLPDGKILLAGWMQVGDGPAHLAFVRANTNGSPDTTFGDNGHVITAVGVGADSSSDLTMQTDGKILVVPGDGAFDAARFNADGSPDAAFGNNGVVTTSFAPDVAQSSAVVVQPSGRIVVAGYLPRLPTANNGNGIALAAYRATGVEPTSTPTAAPPPSSPTPPPGCIFADVCNSDYFATPVQYLVSHGAISGYGDSSFRPFNPTTRSQLVKVVVIASGLKLVTPPQPTFNDVAPGDAFYRYVETAAANGFIAGYADGTFRPYSSVTRGQLSKIVVLARRWTPLQAATPSFSDVPTASPFYGYIERAHERGIISGYGNGSFRPGENATRAQVAKIVYLALQAGK